MSVDASCLCNAFSSGVAMTHIMMLVGQGINIHPGILGLFRSTRFEISVLFRQHCLIEGSLSEAPSAEENGGPS